MELTIEGLDDVSRARACALRLLSEYSIAELTPAVYFRAYRILHPRHDPLLAKVRRKGKPGPIAAHERKELVTLRAIGRMKALVGVDG
jgi:hypothetical protein